MLGPSKEGSHPPGAGSRDAAAERARHAVMAVAKAHTLLSGAANSLSSGHREMAEEAFTLLEEAVRDLRDVVARLEGELRPAATEDGEAEQRS